MRVLFLLGFPNPFPRGRRDPCGFLLHASRGTGPPRRRGGDLFPQGGAPRLLAGAGIRLWNICPAFSVDSIPSRILNIPLAFLALVPLLLVKRPDVGIISVATGGPAIGAYFAARSKGGRVVMDHRG